MSRYHISGSEGEYEKTLANKIWLISWGPLLLIRWMRLNLSCKNNSKRWYIQAGLPLELRQRRMYRQSDRHLRNHAGRGAKYPLAFLSEWTGGYLFSDDYDAYKAVAKENSRIINAGCWSHTRRRFSELYKASGEPRASIPELLTG